MKEEAKQKEPQSSGKIVEKEERNVKGQFIEGHTKLGGNKKGSISILSGIKKYLREHPDKMQELIGYYVENKKMRELLLKMIDGAPKTNIGFDAEDITTKINIEIIKPKKDGEEDTGNNSIPKDSKRVSGEKV